jgi:uncharacterized membrane protein YesL
MTIIGIPFATLGIFAMMNASVQGRQPGFFHIFIGAIRSHWRKAVFIGLIDLLIGSLLFLNFSIFQFMGMDNMIAVLSRTMTICVSVVLIMTNIYIWSLISLLHLSIRDLIKLSLLLVLIYPIQSLGITLIVLTPIIVSFFLPIAFFLFVTVSISAYIGARGTWFVLNGHFSEDALSTLMSD